MLRVRAIKPMRALQPPGPKGFGQTVLGADAVEFLHDIFSLQTLSHIDGQAFAREVVEFSLTGASEVRRAFFAAL